MYLNSYQIAAISCEPKQAASYLYALHDSRKYPTLYRQNFEGLCILLPRFCSFGRSSLCCRLVILCRSVTRVFPNAAHCVRLNVPDVHWSALRHKEHTGIFAGRHVSTIHPALRHMQYCNCPNKQLSISCRGYIPVVLAIAAYDKFRKKRQSLAA